MQLQNHLGWKRPIISNPPFNATVRNPSLNHILKCHTTCLLNMYRSCDSTTVLGSLFQCLMTLWVNKFLLLSNPSLPWSTWALFSPILLLLVWNREKLFISMDRTRSSKGWAGCLYITICIIYGIHCKYLNPVLRNMWWKPLSKEEIHYTYVSFESYCFFPLDKYQEAWCQRLPTGWNRDLSKCEMILFRSKLKHLAITVVSGV